MSKAKIYCEVICGKCGALACNSKYYKNAFTISSLKENTKDWIWDDKLAMNVCPDCKNKRNKKSSLMCNYETRVSLADWRKIL